MKKVFITFSLLVLTFLISGCGCSKKNLKTVTCKMEKESTYNFTSDYTIKYNEKNEQIIFYEENVAIDSKDESIDLNSLKEYFEKNYAQLNELENFNFSTNVENNILTINISINYEKIDKDKLLEIDQSYGNYIENDIFNYKKFLNELETLGAICS